MQRLSAERQRSYVEVQKRRVDQLVEESEGAADAVALEEQERGSLELGRVRDRDRDAQQQQQLLQQQPGVSVQELEFQETLIAEREQEIREIESGIHELNDIFRDLGTIVADQGGLIGASQFSG